MENVLFTLFCAALSYLLGSVMGAYWISRWLGLPDPWQHESCNPGATNIYRLGGWVPAALTLIWDAAKGAIGVGLALWGGLNTFALGLVAVAAVTGHTLPLFHRFEGGKGVATVLGCGLVLATMTTLALVLIWGGVFYWKRISSLAALGCACSAPLVSWWLEPQYTPLFFALAIFIGLRHRDNIVKLAKGNESSL